MRVAAPRLLIAALVAAMGLAFAAAGPTPARAAEVLEPPSGGAPAAPLAPPVIPAPAPERVHYIVLLDEPPVAQYRGTIPGLAGTAADLTGDVHLRLDTPAVSAYTRHLDTVRERVIQEATYLIPEFTLGWEWTIVANGFSAELYPASVATLQHIAEVDLVHPAEELYEEMDSTPALLHLAAAWQAAGGPAEAGLNARIGTLEGGMVDHPWFRDEGMPEPPAGFPNALLIGRNQTLAYPDPGVYTNNKLIGARAIVRNATEQGLTGGADPSLCSATGCSSHGAHVMGTATGRSGTYEVDFGGVRKPLEMTGVAPMAWLFVYQNFDSTPGMVTGIEQMVKDDIDVFNASLGQSGWLIGTVEDHPISRVIDAAADAGTLAVVSSGNSGANGPTALSGTWKYSERLLAVGNTTSPGLSARHVTLAGDDVPETLRDLAVGSRGSAATAITVPLTAELYDAGDGCAIDTNAFDKIAVVRRFDKDGGSIGSCSYGARADNMNASGAVAIAYMYYDRAFGGDSATALSLPSVAFGAQFGGAELMAWLEAGNTAVATIGSTVERTYDNIPDLLAGSSSQGPGLDWGVKPDISAPGTDIYSAVGSGNADNRVYDVQPLSGTSMASPHVAGSATLLRSIHPDWTTDQVRSALITTSAPTVVADALSLRQATVGEGGPGRVDLAYAFDPGAFLYPPKLGFGVVPGDEVATLEVAIESASEDEETWTLSIEPRGGDATVSVSEETLTLAPDETATFEVSLATEGATEADAWGHVVLKRGDSENVLRLAYNAYVDRPEDRKDVLVIDWAYGDTEDFTPYYTEALDAAGLSYDVYVMSESDPAAQPMHPSYRQMFTHDLVILNTNQSPVSLQARLAGQFQYQNYLLGGGNMLVAGQGTTNWWRWLSTDTRYADNPTNKNGLPDTWPYAWQANSQNGGCEMCIARYFAGFTPEITATLSGRLLVPFPTAPDMPEREVVLPPHPDAEGPYGYPIDLSTGDMAPEGAAGNQYTFASGGVISDFVESGNAQITAQHGDLDYAETMIAELAALARPLWAYTGDFATADGGTAEQTKVVGTVVAGRQDPESSIGWNAMFWGFGLEGVGEGAEGTVSQTRLLGDTFNFLVHNFAPTGPMAVELENDPAADGTARLGMVFPEVATAPRVEELTIDWGDGSEAETRAFVRPVAADQLVLDHGYAAEGSYEVVVHVLPAAHAAPFTVAGTIEADAANLTPTIYLPTVANAYDPAAEAVDPGAGPFGAGAGAWRPRARAVRPIAR